MKFAVAFDHHGATLRAPVLSVLIGLRHEVLDLGTDARTPAVSESEKAVEIREALSGGRVERGVLVASFGASAAIAANKIDGIRARVCHDAFAAQRGVEHEGMKPSLPQLRDSRQHWLGTSSARLLRPLSTTMSSMAGG